MVVVWIDLALVCSRVRDYDFSHALPQDHSPVWMQAWKLAGPALYGHSRYKSFCGVIRSALSVFCYHRKGSFLESMTSALGAIFRD